MKHTLLITLLLAPLAALHGAAAATELPRFIVPGHEADMKALNELHALHHDAAFTDCTLWDAWLPQSTLWASERKRAQYRASFKSSTSPPMQTGGWKYADKTNNHETHPHPPHRPATGVAARAGCGCRLGA